MKEQISRRQFLQLSGAFLAWPQIARLGYIDSVTGKNEGEFKYFSEEIKNDPYLSEIKFLADAINMYSSQVTCSDVKNNKKARLGTWLKNFSWYEDKKKKLNESDLEYLDSALRVIDGHTYAYYSDNNANGKIEDNEYQAIQCVTFAIFLSSLGEDKCPVSVGGQNVKNAKELTPAILKKNIDSNIQVTENGLRFLAGRKLTMDKFKAGDLFILPGGKCGHVGVIVADKVISGENYILVAEANRENTGTVRMVEVDKDNFDEVFGSYPDKKILIKK